MIFCLGALIMIVYELLYVRKIKKRGELTSGYLINYISDKNGNAKPLIEFETASKEKVSGHPYMTSSINISGIQLNEKKNPQEIKIIYNKNKPTDFILPDNEYFNNLIFGIIILFVVVMLGLSIYDLIFGTIF